MGSILCSQDFLSSILLSLPLHDYPISLDKLVLLEASLAKSSYDVQWMNN